MSHARALVFFVACLAAMPASAFDGNGEYAAQGAATCAVYLAPDRRQPDGSAADRDRGWLEGVIHAFNWLVPDTFQVLGERDVPAVLGWLDTYCRENPAKDTADGVEALVADLYPHRHRSKKAYRGH